MAARAHVRLLKEQKEAADLSVRRFRDIFTDVRLAKIARQQARDAIDKHTANEHGERLRVMRVQPILLGASRGSG